MKFSNITGVINKVPLTVYKDLIDSYVEVVKNIGGVKSIIQIGSFTAPGLSDIDIIIIVDDNNPPKWEDISILKILKEKNGYEVIAHDVFVYPESLAIYIEGLFYLDRKKILYGNNIGGFLSQKKIDELKLILTFEYTIHRLETLVVLISLPQIKIRDILLFISTLRHTFKLLNDFNIISDEEKENRIQQIENLRTKSLNNDSQEFKEELNSWIATSFKAIFESALLLGERMNYNKLPKLNKWILNKNKLVYSVDDINKAFKFFVDNERINKNFKAKLLFECMPSYVYSHIDKYKKINIAKNEECKNLDALSLRYKLANEHKDFIIKNNYPIAKSYIIIKTEKYRFQDNLKENLLKFISLLN